MGKPQIKLEDLGKLTSIDGETQTKFDILKRHYPNTPDAELLKMAQAKNWSSLNQDQKELIMRIGYQTAKKQGANIFETRVYSQAPDGEKIEYPNLSERYTKDGLAPRGTVRHKPSKTKKRKQKKSSLRNFVRKSLGVAATAVTVLAGYHVYNLFTGNYDENKIPQRKQAVVAQKPYSNEERITIPDIKEQKPTIERILEEDSKKTKEELDLESRVQPAKSAQQTSPKNHIDWTESNKLSESTNARINSPKIQAKKVAKGAYALNFDDSKVNLENIPERGYVGWGVQDRSKGFFRVTPNGVDMPITEEEYNRLKEGKVDLFVAYVDQNGTVASLASIDYATIDAEKEPIASAPTQNSTKTSYNDSKKKKGFFKKALDKLKSWTTQSLEDKVMADNTSFESEEDMFRAYRQSGMTVNEFNKSYGVDINQIHGRANVTRGNSSSYKAFDFQRTSKKYTKVTV